MNKEILKEPSNIARIPASLTQPNNNFFRLWLEFMKPLHNLSAKESDVLGFYLTKRFELTKSITDETLLNSVLFSMEVRKELKESLNMSTSHVHVVLSKLKKVGILTKDGINRKYIPNIKLDKDNYMLIFLFDLK